MCKYLKQIACHACIFRDWSRTLTKIFVILRVLIDSYQTLQKAKTLSKEPNFGATSPYLQMSLYKDYYLSSSHVWFTLKSCDELSPAFRPKHLRWCDGSDVIGRPGTSVLCSSTQLRHLRPSISEMASFLSLHSFQNLFSVFERDRIISDAHISSCL